MAVKKASKPQAKKKGQGKQKPKVKGRAGKPSKWESNVEGRIDTIRSWKAAGLTDAEISDNLGITQQSLITYKKAHLELLEALKTGKSDADAQVINSLYKRAIGYEYEEVETTISETKDGDFVKTRTIKKQMAPDVTAQIFWLKNRCSKDWHDRKQTELTGPDGGKCVVLLAPNSGMLRTEDSDDAANNKG